MKNQTTKVIIKKDYNHGFVRKKTATSLVKNNKSFTIRPSGLHYALQVRRAYFTTFEKKYKSGLPYPHNQTFWFLVKFHLF